jgi:hypothetical protein
MKSPEKKAKKASIDESTLPDTARVYERAKPECESGMGRLDNNKATPAKHPDRITDAVSNKQPNRQINSEEEQISEPVKNADADQ